jgi:CRISPR/Cas system-associated exonuclease Cas4 (RecB family)
MTLEEKIKQSFFNLLERPRTPGSIHVSALPFCLRKEFFNIKFNATPTPVAAMISGKIHHLAIKHLEMFRHALEDEIRDDYRAITDTLLERFKRVDFEAELEQDLKDGYKLRGRADVITNSTTVWEFKFTKRLNSHELDPLYFAQANAYAVMADCERFILVKVHRETYDVRVLEGTADKEAFEALKQRALMLIDCLENNTIPQGPELEWECKNCVYSIVCSNLKSEQRL